MTRGLLTRSGVIAGVVAIVAFLGTNLSGYHQGLAARVGSHWLSWCSWVCAGLACLGARFLPRGRTVRALCSIRDSEVAAASSCVSLPIYKSLAFGVSAGFAGVAGSLFVLVTNGFAQPNE